MKKKIYISLPISGRDIETVKAECIQAKSRVEAYGLEAVSPLDVSPDPEATYAEHIGRDITALLGCDAVWFLDGYKGSKGCRLEYAAASIYKIMVLESERQLGIYAILSQKNNCMNMETKQRIEKYRDSCNGLLELFCKKHGFDFEDASKSWVGNIVGDIVCCGDCFFDMEVIATDLENNVPEEELLRWYYYDLECNALGATGCNYRSWLKGCPRLSEAQLEELRKANKRVQDAKDELKKYINGLGSDSH